MPMASNSEYTIDLERIIRSYAGNRVPAFVIRFLKRLVHEDEINAYLAKGYEGVDFCEGVVQELGVEIAVEGLEELPDKGRFTFVSNHPLGAIDGVALGGIIGRRYNGRVKYLVRELLMNLKGLAPLCVGINKFGAQSRDLPRQIDEAFQSDNHIIMFPAGLCSRLINGQIHDIPWGKAFITKSIQSQRDIVPVHFIGENSPRFYRIAKWCKRLGIKFNLAMILLPDEMFKSRGNHYTVRFGKPIPYQTFDSQRTPIQWAQWVQDTVYQL